tara:strand:+ start:298 stop:735 length:438 start_codon:yes stop_codon:yes gene_type:complete
MKTKDKPYVLIVAENIYLEIVKIKKNNSNFTNNDSIDAFIGSEKYKFISSGNFHNELIKEIKMNKLVEKKNQKKIPSETLRLLEIQREMIMKQLIEFPDLYYAKSHFPLEISQRAFDQIWRMCESYELWCKETKQNELILLKIIE